MMPRFFLDVVDGDKIDPDRLGMVFPDLATAISEAQDAIGALDDEPTGAVAVSIRDGQAVVAIVRPGAVKLL